MLDGSAVAAATDLAVIEVVRNATLRMDDAENPTAGVYRLNFALAAKFASGEMRTVHVRSGAEIEWHCDH